MYGHRCTAEGVMKKNQTAPSRSRINSVPSLPSGQLVSQFPVLRKIKGVDCCGFAVEKGRWIEN